MILLLAVIGGLNLGESPDPSSGKEAAAQYLRNVQLAYKLALAGIVGLCSMVVGVTMYLSRRK
jgi:hypothetical protein